MKLHLCAVPHTVTRDDFSHDAFTMKVKNFSPMLRARGFEVIHYGIEGSESGANEDVEILTRAEHLALMGIDDYHTAPRVHVDQQARTELPVYVHFNFHLREALKERLAPGDVICMPRGEAHQTATKTLPLVRSGEVVRMETGIGYPECVCLTRVYESEAWRHWILGREQRSGAGWNTPRLEWVIPNYYDVNQWPLVDQLTDEEERTVVFLGRVEDVKGLALIPRLAKARPDLRFVICGQGNPAPYLGLPNVDYQEPISGRARADYLGRARCALFPSRFVEPFCGTHVEAMLCGTPVITSDFGVFTETVDDGLTGIRCRDERAWLAALDRVVPFSRRYIHLQARQRFGLEPVGLKYATAFMELADRMPTLREVFANGVH